MEIRFSFSCIPRILLLSTTFSASSSRARGGEIDMASAQETPNATALPPQQAPSAHEETHRPQAAATNNRTWAMRHMKCVVCLDFMETAAMMKCGHVVCRECLLRIMSSNSRSCPICRAPLGHSSPRILEFFVQDTNQQAAPSTTTS